MTLLRQAPSASAAAAVLTLCALSFASAGYSSASASAVAVSGGSTSSGGGSPSTAFSSSVAGPGQDASSSVVVVNGKTLVNDSKVVFNQGAADPAWDAAPACPAAGSAAQPIVLDSLGRPWSWNPATQQSCAVRYSAEDPAWDAAPRCTFAPTSNNATPDASGRLWSWQSGASCAHKDSDGTPVYYDGYQQAGGQRRALLGRAGDDASSAAAATTTSATVTARAGAAADAPAAAAAASVELQQLLDWTAALPCPMAPNANNSAADARSWLWGRSTEGVRCAFKASGSQPLYYPGYVAADYDLAPLCSATVSRATAMADAHGRLWNWEVGVNCVHTCERPSDQLAAALAAAAVHTAVAANTSAAGAEAAAVESQRPATSESVAVASDSGSGSVAAAAAQVAVDATVAAAVDAHAAAVKAAAAAATSTQAPANASAAQDKAEAEVVRAAAHGDALVALMDDPETAAALAEAAGPADAAAIKKDNVSGLDAGRSGGRKLLRAV